MKREFQKRRLVVLQMRHKHCPTREKADRLHDLRAGIAGFLEAMVADRAREKAQRDA